MAHATQGDADETAAFRMAKIGEMGHGQRTTPGTCTRKAARRKARAIIAIAQTRENAASHSTAEETIGNLCHVWIAADETLQNAQVNDSGFWFARARSSKVRSVQVAGRSVLKTNSMTDNHPAPE